MAVIPRAHCKAIISMGTILLFAISCSVNKPDQQPGSGYPVTTEEAISIVYHALQTSYPDAPVEIIRGDTIGVSVRKETGLYTRQAFVELSPQTTTDLDPESFIAVTVSRASVAGAMHAKMLDEVEDVVNEAFLASLAPGAAPVEPIPIETKEIHAYDSNSSKDADPFKLLERLKSLHDNGVLTEEEYRNKKSELLKRI